MVGELKYEQKGVWKRLSDAGRLMLREKYSIGTYKCIYPRQGFSSVGGGFERDFIAEVLEPSAEVKAYAKLDKKHGLKIPYRDEYEILRNYEIDFIVKTDEMIYLVETKADRDLDKLQVVVKAKAAHSWCQSASMTTKTNDIRQPDKWEYLIISEGLFNSNRGQSFGSLVPLCQMLRDSIIVKSVEISPS